MKLNHFFSMAVLAVAASMLASCDTVDKNDRLIYVKRAEVNRSVLIEDFTGQRCVNCPTATAEIEKLQEEYGADAIIAVGIHSGPFAHRSTMTSARLSLCTETGDDYYTHWGIESQPSIMVNRGKPIENVAQYATAVSKALEQLTPLEMTLDAVYDAATRTVTINVSANTSEDVSGKLQVWVTEDNIVDVQYMPNNSVEMEYVHQHVFRTSVTADIYGDDFTLVEGATKSASYETTLEESWVPENVSIVAFVSNTANGVLQVVKAPIVKNE